MSDKDDSDVSPLLLPLRPGKVAVEGEESYDAYRARVTRENAEATKELGDLFAANPLAVALLAIYGEAALDLLPDNRDTEGVRKHLGEAFQPLVAEILRIAPGLEGNRGTADDILRRHLTAIEAKS